jgi:hypothetical protein
MGLDSFKSDNEDSDNDTGSSDSAGSDGTDTGDKHNSGGTSNGSGSSDTAKGGLDSFRTSATRGGSTNNNDKDKQDSNVFGIPPRKWRNMSIKQRVARIRESEIPDFKPDLQLDDRWGWGKAARIQCVCNNTFYIKNKGKCPFCNREYSMENRTVVKTEDPEDTIIHNNE